MHPRERIFRSNPSTSLTWASIPTDIRGSVADQHPGLLTHFGPRRADGGRRFLPRAGKGADRTGDGRVSGDRPEHDRLGPKHAHIRQAAPARRDGQYLDKLSRCSSRALLAFVIKPWATRRAKARGQRAEAVEPVGR